MSPNLSSAAFPSISEASQRQTPAGPSCANGHGNGNEQQHPLKPYWEYLSFLFRRQPEPEPDQMLELSYRDYLQVGHMLLMHTAVLLSGLGLCGTVICCASPDGYMRLHVGLTLPTLVVVKQI